MIQKTFNFLSLRINAAQLDTQAGPDVPCKTHTHMRFSRCAEAFERASLESWRYAAEGGYQLPLRTDHRRRPISPCALSEGKDGVRDDAVFGWRVSPPIGCMEVTSVPGFVNRAVTQLMQCNDSNPFPDKSLGTCCSGRTD